ncbi:SRPBCC family protein [bacterium]|nr:SRPBCC family protein [candidate division CSSED10-310 bacterium]
MKLYRLDQRQVLKITLEQAWAFFSNPRKLPEITPDWLSFNLLNDPPETMHPGMIIHYTVTPLLGLPLQWVSEITHVREPEFFVDEQRFGPYRFWHHQHHFKPVAEGTLVLDIVNYRLPLGPAGSLVHAAVVRRRLERIFDYRRQRLDEVHNIPAVDNH